jgi:hypothetical protein
MSDLNDEAEQRAREYVGGDLDWSIEENQWATAPMRAHFRYGFLAGVERQAQRIADLEKQLAAAKESADYAWKNARTIDAARMEVERRLADVSVALSEMSLNGKT